MNPSEYYNNVRSKIEQFITIAQESEKTFDVAEMYSNALQELHKYKSYITAIGPTQNRTNQVKNLEKEIDSIKNKLRSLQE